MSSDLETTLNIRRPIYKMIDDCMILLSNISGISYGALIDFENGEVHVSAHTSNNIVYDYTINVNDINDAFCRTLHVMLKILHND